MGAQLDDDAPRYVSTGQLPAPNEVRTAVTEAYERYRSDDRGELSQVYPALARVREDLFGISVVGTNGAEHGEGDADVEFALMSVAKPFAFALVCEGLGPEEARRSLGVNATG